MAVPYSAPGAVGDGVVKVTLFAIVFKTISHLVDIVTDALAGASYLNKPVNTSATDVLSREFDLVRPCVPTSPDFDLAEGRKHFVKLEEKQC